MLTPRRRRKPLRKPFTFPELAFMLAGTAITAISGAANGMHPLNVLILTLFVPTFVVVLHYLCRSSKDD